MTARLPIDENDPTTYVVCEICEEKIRKLSSFHAESHGITMQEYRDLFPDSPVSSKATRGRNAVESSRRMKEDPAYYDTMCDNLARGHDTMFDNPEIGEARLAKSHASRRGNKNRPDHGCKGWTHVWDSMDAKERSDFIDDRYKWQSDLGATGPRGCTVHYIDRRLQPHTFKSRHELAHAIYLDILKLDWMYEGWPIEYKDEDGKSHKYWPDFVTHDPFLYHEVKPFGMGEAVTKKMEAVKEATPNLVMITHEYALESGTWRFAEHLEENDTVDFTRIDLTLRNAA